MIFTVAIDGPAAAGKGTISRAVAAEFGFAHLDTGLLYRAVGAKGGDPIAAARGLSEADLARDGLRTLEAGQAASRVAVIPEVRTALVDFQRNFARRQGGAVLDGRDIGTVICPQAEVKLYVTASAEVRAHRRWLEVGGDEAKVLAEVKERDARDMGRADAPLKAAADAVVIDTSEMGIEEAVARAVEVVKNRFEHAESRYADLNNSRGHAGVFAQDRETMPRHMVEFEVATDWAKSAAEWFGWSVESVRSNPLRNDPPDCFAAVNGMAVQIELTELFVGELDAKLKEASKYYGERRTWADVILPSEELWWDETRFRSEITRLVARKSKTYRKSKRHFDFLVIYAAVPFTSAAMVESWLQNGLFEPSPCFGEVHLLFDYDPTRPAAHPLFRLTPSAIR